MASEATPTPSHQPAARRYEIACDVSGRVVDRVTYVAEGNSPTGVGNMLYGGPPFARLPSSVMNEQALDQVKPVGRRHAGAHVQ